jgi:hypothetical protein
LIALILILIIISCKDSPKINLIGEWKGIDVNKEDSVSLAILINHNVEYSRANEHTLYGNWTVDTSANGKLYVDLKLINPLDPKEFLNFKPIEIVFFPEDKIGLRLANQTLLKQNCDTTNIG